MRALRAVIFNILFYLWTIASLLMIMPLLFFSRHIVRHGLKTMMAGMLLLQRTFGLKVEFRGLHNIPQGGCLVAAKHQSMWETFMLGPLFPDPAFVYKRELEKIPLLGFILRKFDMVPVDRAKGAAALRTMVAEAAEKIRQGRELIIFPEGTRKVPGTAGEYKSGVALLYEKAQAPVVPVALNSGVYWSNYAWRGKQGTLIVDILSPIPPNLPRDEFMKTLQMRLETASNALLKN